MDPVTVAVNPVTNKIYVVNYSSANVTVIDEVRRIGYRPASHHKLYPKPCLLWRQT